MADFEYDPAYYSFISKTNMLICDILINSTFYMKASDSTRLKLKNLTTNFFEKYFMQEYVDISPNK
jgi:hypothetical protein